MKIGIYGGAFDPVHNGHVAVGVAAAKHVDFLYVMPCYNHSYGKQLTNANHRIQMLDLAFQGQDNIIVSDFEVRKQLSGSSYELVTQFVETFEGENEFYFVIGEDNALDLKTKWDHADELIGLVNCIVVPRADKTGGAWYKQAPHIYLDDFKIINVSSTQIRKSSRDKIGRGHLPNLVNNYISVNGLYNG